MHRQIGHPSLAETLLPQALGRNGGLERIDEEVDWEKFGTLVEGIYSAEEGRPSYPPLMMVKEGTLMDATLVATPPTTRPGLGDHPYLRVVEPGVPQTPMQTGASPVGGHRPTSATKCMLEWMKERGWCARRC